MIFDPGKHHRRSIRMEGYDYTQPGGYFVTIVARQRKCIFGEILDGEMLLSAFGQVGDECWCAIPGHFPNVELGAHVIMPNHLHAIIILKHPEDAQNHSSEIQCFINDPDLSNTDDFDENEYFNDDQDEIWNGNEKSPGDGNEKSHGDGNEKSPGDGNEKSHGDGNEKSHGDGNEKSHGDGNEKSHGDGNGNVQTHGRASLRAGQSAQSNLYRPPHSISSFMAGFKSATTSKIDDFIDLHHLPIPKYNRNNRLWQLNYNDHIIRNDREYSRIKSYIQNNPKKWEKDKFKS